MLQAIASSVTTYFNHLRWWWRDENNAERLERQGVLSRQSKCDQRVHLVSWIISYIGIIISYLHPAQLHKWLERYLHIMISVWGLEGSSESGCKYSQSVISSCCAQEGTSYIPILWSTHLAQAGVNEEHPGLDGWPNYCAWWPHNLPKNCEPPFTHQWLCTVNPSPCEQGLCAPAVPVQCDTAYFSASW